MKTSEFLDSVSKILDVEPDSATLQTIHDETQILHSNYHVVMERYGKIAKALTGGVVPVDQLLGRIEELVKSKPRLSEIRYVLHGDIQPCSVLYSDETTTLLRLDEGDIMCETDMIEWSDSVTYRCQELLADAMEVHGRAVNQRALRAVAQLVREGKLHLDDSVTGVETCDA